MNLAIVIPAHNEEERIKKTLKSYLDFFNNLSKKESFKYKIIVVLNACIDNTKAVVESFNSKNIIILEFERGGKGFAVIEGFKEALKRNFDPIGFVDADMSTPPEAFYDLVKACEKSDGAIANRWHKKSIIPVKQTLFRRFISRSFNLIVRALFLFPHRDTQCGAKVFRAEVIQKILPKLGSSEWAFDIDLLFYSRRINAKIVSVPTTWEDRGGSKVNLKKTPIKMLLAVVRLRLLHSPLKILIRVNQLLPERLRFKP